MIKRENLDGILLNYFHPAFDFFNTPSLSFNNIQNYKQYSDIAVGFLIALSFLEKNHLNNFPEKSFSLDENLLPKIDMSQFDTTSQDASNIILQLLSKIFFKDRNISRGKIPKNLQKTGSWVRNLQKRRVLSAKQTLIELLQSLINDKIPISLPPLWSIGIKWEPSLEFSNHDQNIFSAKHNIYLYLLKNWAKANDYLFITAESNLPYPFASLEPILKHLLDDQTLVSKFLQENVSKGIAAVAEKMADFLVKKNQKYFIWGAKSDLQSQKVIETIVTKQSLPLICCFKNCTTPPLTIKEIDFLLLLEEGKEWLKENLSILNIDETTVCDYVLEKEFLRFSPYSSLFIEEFYEKKVRTVSIPKTPLQFVLNSLVAKDKVEKEKLLLRSLIASGQAVVALERIANIQNLDDEFLFLKLWAKSLLGEYSYILKEKDKIKQINSEDSFSLSIFIAQALWLSGKFEEGKKLLKNLLKQSKNENQKFRALSQLFLLNFNCGDSEIAEKILYKMDECIDTENIKDNILINHHKGALEKSKNNQKMALEYFIKAKDFAKKGGYHFHETLFNIEIGNTLRLLGRFDESIAYLEKAIFQAQILRLSEIEKKAKFDITISEVEFGALLKAEEEITALINKREESAPIGERAVEYYWFSRILFFRGELLGALEKVDKALSFGKKGLEKEIYISLNILKGNILYYLNNLKSLQVLLKKIEQENIFSLGDDFILEYCSLLMLCSKKKLASVSEQIMQLAEKSFEKGSPLSKMTFLLAKAQKGDENSYNSAKEALSLAEKHNNNIAKIQSLFILYKMCRLPEIGEKEINLVATFLKENRVKGELCDLLKICENKKISNESKENSLITFLCKSLKLKKEESCDKFLNLCGVSGLATVSPSGEIFVSGNSPSRNEIASLSYTETEKSIGKFQMYSIFNKDGIWGAIFSENNLTHIQKDFFSLYFNLQKDEEKISQKEEFENFGFIDKIIFGRSPAIMELKRKIVDIALFNFPVLVTGEAGSGKEACSKAIHLSSQRGKKEWVPFNCANLTPTLATSQLFGHKKGSFTGADSDKEGLVAAAKDSTLFLDEIGELPLETQAQFLRFLQDGSYQPLGSNKTLFSNARIIAATNRDLKSAVSKGTFREDLYFRLKVISIEVPPLRERKEDIIPLFEKFLEEECQKENVKKPLVKKVVYNKLLSYSWFGNVRELQNFVKRVIVSSRKSGIIDEKQIIFEKGTSVEKMTLNEKIEVYEKELIEEILKRNSFNILKSSKEAGLSRQAFYQRAKKYGLIKLYKI